jgi:hypothetical protein
MEQLTCERLQDNLKRLKLTRAAEILDHTVMQSENDKVSYLIFPGPPPGRGSGQ